MIGPENEDQAVRIERLMNRAREWERRVLNNISVTDSGTGTPVLEITPLPSDPNKSLVVIRDAAGHDLLKNDTVAGWGLAAPQNAYSAYPALPFMKSTSTSFTEMWLYSGYTYSRGVEWAYVCGSEFADTFSECRFEFSHGFGPIWTVAPNTTYQSNNDVSDSSTVYTVFAGTFEIPITAAGQFWAIRLMQRKAAGTGTNVYCTPVYLNAY